MCFTLSCTVFCLSFEIRTTPSRGGLSRKDMFDCSREAKGRGSVGGSGKWGGEDSTSSLPRSMLRDY